MRDDRRSDVRGDRAVERHILEHHGDHDLRIVRWGEPDEPGVIELDTIAVNARLRGARLTREGDALDGRRCRRSTGFSNPGQCIAQLGEIGIAELKELMTLRLLAYHLGSRRRTVGRKRTVEARHIDYGLRVVP